MNTDIRHSLSSPQEAVWLDQLLAPDLPCYNIGTLVRVDGLPQPQLFDAALQYALSACDALRIVLEPSSGRCLQRFGDDAEPVLQRVDFTGRTDADAAALDYLRGRFAAPITLYGSRLWAMHWVQTGAERAYWLVVFHHLAVDGLSVSLIGQVIAEAYNRLVRGEPLALPADEAPPAYRDFVLRDAEYFASPRFAKDAEFWRERFPQLPPPLFEQSAGARGRGRRRYGQIVWPLARADYGRLSDAAAALGGSSTQFLMAALAAYFARAFDRSEEVVIGMPVHNRSGAAQRRTVGMFSAAIPVGIAVDPQRRFAELVRDVAADLKRSYRHQRFPLAEIQRQLLAGTTDRRSLFDVSLSMEGFLGELGLDGGVRTQVLPLHNGYERQPLAIYVRDYEPERPVHIEFNFDPDVFDDATMATHVQRLQRLTLAAVADPQLPVAALPLMDEAETQRVVHDFNTPVETFPVSGSIAAAFERQALLHAQAVALRCDGESLSYGELNRRANQLARHLRTLGAGPDVLVGLHLQRGFDLVVAILATLKAGSAYLPLDPAYPAERLHYMLDDAKPAVLLTQSLHADALATSVQTARVVIDAMDWRDSAWGDLSTDDLGDAAVGLEPGHLAYVIYTSGSTGQPKGVMIEHRHVLRLFAATGHWFGFGSDDVWSLFHSFAFDFSVWELWGALLHGGRLVIVPQAVSRAPQAFHALVCAEGVTVLNQTPSAFRSFIAADAAGEGRHRLRQVVFGGEALDVALLKPWYARPHNAATQLVNMYGITETTVHVTYHALQRLDVQRSGPSPIGARIPDLRLYVLDPQGQPLPPGVSGELHVGGAGVARGYLHRPELTAQRFVPDPFVPGERLYRSGDLARWREDGTLEYLGRNDSQVKIRGFRIELGEIQAQLLALPGVADAVVLARRDGDGDARLIAYLVATTADAFADPAQLREQLAQVLPDYMLPAAFVALERLPLTANGKLDRDALPAPEAEALARSRFEAPQTATEQRLASLWTELLGAADVGRHDNFFALGGHSLLAVRLMELLHEAGLSADIQQLFTASTLAAFAAAIDAAPVKAVAAALPPNAIPHGCTAITPDMLPLARVSQAELDAIAATVPGGMANIQDIYPLSPLQQGILFHHLLERDGDAYVLPALLRFDDSERLQRFVAALNQVIARHDILRTAVLWQGLGQPLQVVWREAHFAPEILDSAGEDATAVLQARAAPHTVRLELQRAPLLRGFAVRDGEGWLLQLLHHHLTLDHTTTERLLQEVVLVLQQRESELPPPLPFRQFVAAALQRDESAAAAHFRRMLAGLDAPTAPFGLLDVQGDGSQVAQARASVATALAQRLRAVARAQGVSAASLFHLAWAQTLGQASSRDDVVFGTVLLGRLHGGGIERAMGMFINTLPLRVALSGDVSAALQRVHADLSALLPHEHTPLTLAQRASGLPANTPLFAALLNYRHSRPQSLEQQRIADGVHYLGGRDLTNYPFSLYIDDLGDDFVLTAEIHVSVPATRVLALMQQSLQSLVTALEQTPQRELSTLTLLPEDERERVLQTFNAATQTVAEPALVHVLVERQAALQPEAIALEFDGECLSYAALNRRANRLARALRRAGAAPDARVALLLERGIDLVVAILATLKAGAAYLPLDPRYPDGRLAQMLTDGEPVIVLTESLLRTRLDTAVPVLVLDEVLNGFEHEDDSDLSVEETGLRSSNLAYVLYTSGSTGQPKGVAMPHAALCNLLQWQQGALPDAARTLQFAAIGFDVAFQEIFSTLAAGGTLVLLSEARRADLPQLAAWIAGNGIERLFLPYIALSSLAELWSQTDQPLPQLRDVIVAGEALRITPALRQVFAELTAARLHNHYGPTESHVVTAETLPVDARYWDDLPSIGKPIANARIRLLDSQGRAVPVGVAGEIHIGGQLALGYLGRPELTSERFITDPFDTRGNAYLYKTGDLGRWREDGRIDYLGRNDFQLKIRGYRIELGEIEAALARQPGVAEAAVIACEDNPGDKRLVAYLVPQADAQTDAVALRGALAQQLPDYMLPAAYVQLAQLPLTPHGKLDRRALPAPQDEAYGRAEHVAPQGDTEILLAQLWSELLGVDSIGRDDDFFQLGGHSLLVVRLVSQLRQRGYGVDVRSLFEQPRLAQLAATLDADSAAPPDRLVVPPNRIDADCTRITPAHLPLVVLSQAQIDAIAAATTGGAAAIQDIYPLSPLQKGILFHHLLQPDADTYVLPTLLAFDRRERLDRFVAALQRVIARHDILRSAVHWQGLDEPVQVVWRAAALPLSEAPIVADGGDIAVQLQAQARQLRLDLATAPLLRGLVAEDPAQGRWLLQLVYHHVIMDHTALDVLVEEIHSLQQGREAELAPPLPYREFVAQARLGLDEAAHARYFRQELEGLDDTTAPFGLADVQGNGQRLCQAQQRLPQELARQLRRVARSQSSSAAALFHLAWAQLLAASSGRDDVVFGTVLFGRLQNGAGADRAVGLFINTLPLRLRLQGITVAAALRQTQTTLAGLIRHEHAELALAQRASSLPANTPLFSALLNYRHGLPVATRREVLPGVHLLSVHDATNYPVALFVDDDGADFWLTAQIDQRVDAGRVLALMQQSLQSLVTALEQTPQRELSTLTLLPEDERERVLQTFNAATQEVAEPALVHILVERQAALQPEAIALEFDGERLSYAALNRRANRLARALRRAGAAPDARVALLLERGIDLVVAILATLKAGAAYLPLDPRYPDGRLAQMLADGEPVIVLTESSLRARLDIAVSVLVLDEVPGGFEHEDDSDLSVEETGLESSNLAYVLYTSGSTGQPKGVAMPHAALCNLLQWQQGVLPDAARTLQFAAIGFDVAFQEIFSTLAAGGTLVLLSEARRADLPQLAAWIAGNGIERLFLPYIALSSLAELWSQADQPLPQLRDVIVAGEALRITPALRQVFAELTTARLHNHYGPTESHVVTAETLPSDARCWDDLPSIGKPIANAHIRLLDSQGRVVPVGVAGEIHIGGQLALGYLGRPELTSERFLADPFNASGNSYLYKTGDLGRWREDGRIDYLGRNDFQLKIRGYRIELGEIEAALARQPGVAEAAVIAREDSPGDKRLVAYLVPQAGADTDAATLRSALAEQLPDYMLPAAYVQLAQLPLTPHGKLDRRALPAPQDEAYGRAEHVVPQGDTEILLAQLWSELLGVDSIGRDDDFFQLGGHSLLAIRLLARVRERLQRELPLAQLFAAPQLQALAAAVAASPRRTATTITAAARPQRLPLSSAQQRLWFVATADRQASVAYHIPAALRLGGALDIDALRTALDGVVARHEALRTRFVVEDGEPWQQISNEIPLALRLHAAIDLSDEALVERCQLLAAEPFDLAHGPLIRAELLQLGRDDHVLLVVLHHLVADGWSLSVLMREVAALYDAARNGRTAALPPLPLQYADYALWQREQLAGELAQEQLRTAVAALREAPALAELPTDRPRPPLQDYRGATVPVALDDAATAALRTLCRRHGVTPYMAVLAAWAATVARASGQDGVVIGSSHAGRDRVELEPLIGFFINTQAIHIDVASAVDGDGLLRQVRDAALQAQALQAVPFERLVEAVNPTRSLAHHPLFQLMLAWHNTPEVPLALQGLSVARAQSLPASAQFDLALDLYDIDGRISGSLNFATALYDAATVQQHWSQLQRVLVALADYAQRPLAQLPLLSAEERERLLHGFNPPPQPRDAQALAHRLIERQAQRRPLATALVHDGQALSYGELDRRVNRLAHYLRKLGVKPDQRIALCLERGIDAVVALLAVLKAGAAYVPLDPAYPAARLAWQLADAAPVVLLAHASLLPRLTPPAGCTVVLADEHAPRWAAYPPTEPATPGLHPAHAAYVIYTSGSTGQPKGVVVEQRQLCHQIAALDALYRFEHVDRVLQFSALTFDVAAEEIFGALAHGATLVLRTDDWLAEPARWCALAAEHSITVANLPTLFWQRIAFDAQAALPTCLRQIVIGGDTVSAAALAAWWRRSGHRPALNNAYGPTETTINATVARCSPDDAPGSIGRPVANARIYVLDAAGEPLPPGVAGEICIGGDGVARGYLERPALTAQRFEADPFAGEGARLYRSGDRGRWRRDGSLEFLGRLDHQVKIRGFRIELEEIQAQLTALDDVAEAAVVLQQVGDDDKRLVAYVVARSGRTLDAAALRAQLAQQLPDYMLPAAFVALAALPLLSNGKLDRHALPAAELALRRAYTEPEGAIETTLARIWGELLEREAVGRDDHFFELGGHSLLAVRLMSQLRRELQVELPLTALFAQPVLHELAAVVAQAQRSAEEPIAIADRSERLPLSPSQQRLWYVTQIDSQAGAAYHIPGALRLRGALDLTALQAAMDGLVQRHEILRTRFVASDGQPCQVVDAAQSVALTIEDATSLDAAHLAQRCRDEAAAPFDLARGPLLRTRLLRCGEDDHLLLLTLHHIIADGWSLSVLAREFSALYSAFRRGQADPLPPLPLQYADYARWQRERLQGGALQHQVDYWTTQLRDAPELLALPTDRPRPAQQDYRGASIAIELDPAQSTALRDVAQRHGITVYMAVLAAWAAVLARLSGQDDVVLGSSVAGRNRAELEPLIGFFVNAQALRFRLDQGQTLAQLLAQAKQLALDAQEHREVPFEQIVEAINPARSMAYNPIYQVRLAWQNTPAVRLALDGLQLHSEGSSAGGAQFDLSLDLEEAGERIVGQLNYATALFDEASVRRHWSCLRAMLRALADDGQAVAEVDLLAAAQRQQLLHEFNDTARDWPQDTLIHTLVEAQARQKPDEIAIVCEDESLTYAELNRRANQLAHALRALPRATGQEPSHGVRPDDRVALCLERSVDLVVGLLAILKAGAAFVPLDPVHPDERLAHMLADSAPVAVLTQAALAPRLARAASTALLVLDAQPWDEAPWAQQPAQDPDPAEIGLQASHLAYVIYTSGSTGTPKGVMVEHRNVLTFLRGLEACIHGLEPQCRRIAWNSSVGFDMGVKGWGQLAFGRTVHLLSERLRLDAPRLLDYVEAQGIEAMECTPSHLRLLQAAGFPQTRGASLVKLLLGGEALDGATWRALAATPGKSFFNMYGPTECSVDASCGPVAGDSPQIGRPMPNARIYLLDSRGRPVPLGAPGEIHIGGAGVARGYLDQPELTALRFLPDPFAGEGARLYRTGDLGRWRSDGSIEYLGRNDFQVKIRGYRIELGEIEARLKQLPGIADAAVLAREDTPGERRLVAYVVAAAGASPDPSALRARLAAQLPDYMLPAAYVALERLPLNANGKLDRAALPAPGGQAAAQHRYEEPVGEIERQLAAAWAELLGVERVGRHDNFFALGGHSALAIQLIHQMSEKQLQVEVQMIFNAPTLADLANATVQLEEVEL